MTHVFVVDDTTFKCHLENMFAGTGAGNKQSPFLLNPQYVNPRSNSQGLTAASEIGLVSMIADISKINIGDNIIFYLQATKNHPGMFFGVFKAKSKAFFDNATAQNYLYASTNKYLTYRILIDPTNNIFEQGVTEHEYLDNLTGKSHPHEMCWSLIYRKLKGNRGCTTITDYEFNDLFIKLKNKNNGKTLNGNSYSYCSTTHSIIAKSTQTFTYQGVQASIDIANRLKYKATNNKAFEAHLQAYIMQNIDSENLNTLLKPIPSNPYWFGNEVACGVGMQRIDSLIIQEDQHNAYFKVIELKQISPYDSIITNQLPWYIQWLNDYIVPKYPNKVIKIKPCVIANGAPNQQFASAAQSATFAVPTEPVEYIGYSISNAGISFIKYF